ncbi:hypothetical protein DesyoDRAFT_4892 [Desulfosporosinus youngiae DSM 17734]|uniref:Uncharacterized protein n=1 Tax=Desulfosporosinus youngiae DSM 17734 TaxID=768710 RepID=H5XZC9_9FIRM|nr:hypothetical protein DesyoDRAFT_4892 [Desulfosporosinus youngiae DSM 17734]
MRGDGATGSHQVLPGGLARKCPVDSFAEAAISKEDLSAEGSSRTGEWATLGMLRDMKALSLHELTNLARMWTKQPDLSAPVETT